MSFDTRTIPAGGRVAREVELRNIVATLPGKTPRRIYVSGHYDTVSPGSRSSARGQAPRPPTDYNVPAPGGNDDGSGTVLSMELARMFAESGIELDATLVFMAVAGEEYGLLGARAHAKRMKEEKVPVQSREHHPYIPERHVIKSGNGEFEAPSAFPSPGRSWGR